MDQSEQHWLWDSAKNTYIVNVRIEFSSKMVEESDNFQNFCDTVGYRTLVYARRRSPFIYVTNGQYLAVICNGKQYPMAYSGWAHIFGGLLQTYVKPGRISEIHSIIGVHNGRISVVANMYGRMGIWTARLKNVSQKLAKIQHILH